MKLNLIEQVAPVQLAIRLLIPEGSLRLELHEIRRITGVFDAGALCYPWRSSWYAPGWTCRVRLVN